MSGHRAFEELRTRMSPERRDRNKAATESLGDELSLNELRLMRKQSQKDVASLMNVLQPAIAKLERRGNVSVNNLTRFVEALGGTLVVTARFPERSVTLRLGSPEGGSQTAIDVKEVG